jgi:hypothetical protein
LRLETHIKHVTDVYPIIFGHIGLLPQPGPYREYVC